MLFTRIVLRRIARLCALSFAPAKDGCSELRIGRQFHDQLFSPLASVWLGFNVHRDHFYSARRVQFPHQIH